MRPLTQPTSGRPSPHTASSPPAACGPRCQAHPPAAGGWVVGVACVFCHSRMLIQQVLSATDAAAQGLRGSTQIPIEGSIYLEQASAVPAKRLRHITHLGWQGEGPEQRGRAQEEGKRGQHEGGRACTIRLWRDHGRAIGDWGQAGGEDGSGRGSMGVVNCCPRCLAGCQKCRCDYKSREQRRNLRLGRPGEHFARARTVLSMLRCCWPQIFYKCTIPKPTICGCESPLKAQLRRCRRFHAPSRNIPPLFEGAARVQRPQRYLPTGGTLHGGNKAVFPSLISVPLHQRNGLGITVSLSASEQEEVQMKAAGCQRHGGPVKQVQERSFRRREEHAGWCPPLIHTAKLTEPSLRQICQLLRKRSTVVLGPRLNRGRGRGG